MLWISNAEGTSRIEDTVSNAKQWLIIGVKGKAE
jgi:hypothetical protein